MSDTLKHECGLAYIRLLKPFSYYEEKYGNVFYGLQKLYLLMEKQRNRGQDGAGIGVLKLNVPFGDKFLKRLRVTGSAGVSNIFEKIREEWKELQRIYPDFQNHGEWLKNHSDYTGEVMIGHLRYATQGLNSIKFCHPFTITNHDPSRNLAMAGNFNLVNTEELFKFLNISPQRILGQSDLGAMIETVYHFLDEELKIHPNNPDIKTILKNSSELFDGGFVCGGLIGNGDSFIMRDKHGIRPAFVFQNNEFIVAASERPAIMTCFNVYEDEIEELPAGHALIVKANGESSIQKIVEPAATITPCSFERIYFSRGNDIDIYKERVRLGKNLVPNILKAIHNDIDNAVFSFIPNTAETAFYGLIQGMHEYLDNFTTEYILKNRENLSYLDIEQQLTRRVRVEKVVLKDVKMRTFITSDNSRNELVNHVYDITSGIVKSGDTLVVIDDSIIRGTTLKQSIIRILDRLNPAKIIIVSSAPQIRYPDCYGIDMSKLGDFIAFQAAIELLKEQKKENILHEIYQQCLKAHQENRLSEKNFVKEIYQPLGEEEISRKISRMLKPDDVNAEVEIIFQSISGLHQACPLHKGDWYFTGDYPTPGGTKVANMTFLNFMENKNQRGY